MVTTSISGMTIGLGAEQHPLLACAEAIDGLLDDVMTVDPMYMRTGDKKDGLTAWARLEARMASVKLRMLASADDIAEETGARSTATWLANETRDGHGATQRAAKLAKAMGRCRLVGDALATGSLNIAQAHVITEAIDALPKELDSDCGTRPRLTWSGEADKFGPRELTRLGERVLEAIAPEIADAAEYKRLLAQERRAKSATKLFFRDRGDGSTDINARVPSHVAKRVRTYVDGYTSPRNSRLGDVDELPLSRRRGEAFCALMENLPASGLPRQGGTATTVGVTIDLDTLLRGGRLRDDVHRRPDHRRGSAPDGVQRRDHPVRHGRQVRDPRPGPRNGDSSPTPSGSPSTCSIPSARPSTARSRRPGAKPTTRFPGPRVARLASRTAPCSVRSTITAPTIRAGSRTTTPTARPPSPGGREETPPVHDRQPSVADATMPAREDAMSDARRLVDKLWSYCNVLRDDGVGTIEYTEQLTYLLFLKMAHERATRQLKPEQIVPDECSWQRLLDADGDELEVDVHAHPGGPRPAARHARHDLPQGAEPDPGPGQAQAADRRPDRQGELVRDRHRHQGRRLRGAALQGRGGHQVRRGPVLHTAPI